MRILHALILVRLALGLGLVGHLILDAVGGMPVSVLLVTSYLLANAGVGITCSSRSHSKSLTLDFGMPEPCLLGVPSASSLYHEALLEHEDRSDLYPSDV